MNDKIRQEERGIALFMVLFALLLLSAIGMGLMYLADTETNINNNYRATQQASAAAYAGLQEVRERMMLINTAPHLITPPGAPPSTATANSVIYVLNPLPAEAVTPTTFGTAYFDNELCHENFLAMGLVNPGNNVPCTAAPGGAGWAQILSSDAPFSATPAAWNAGGNAAGALSYKWVRINWKVNSSLATSTMPVTSYYVNGSNAAGTQQTSICWDGSHEILNPLHPNPCEGGGGQPQTTIYQLTSLAVTPTGARRMAQMEVAQQPPLITNAAVDSQDHVTLNGQLNVTGYDACSCSCTTTKQGNNYVMTCVDLPPKTCDKSKYAIYSSSAVDNPGSSEQIFAGPSPAIAQNAPWNYDIPSLISQYSGMANAVDATAPCGAGVQPCGYTCSGSPAACGTQSGQQFGIPPAFPPTPPDNPASDPTLGPQQQQVTYVPGNLQITGGSIGNGILIVDGDLDIHGGLQFYGLILVKGVISFTGGGSDKTNVFGSVLAGQESKVDTVLGGSANINFDMCALPQGAKNQPPRYLSYRELNY